MMVCVYFSEDNCLAFGKQTNKRWAICKQVVSLQLSNICTAASRIPLFIFFSPQTILIQNIYRNPQNSAQTADGSHCKSHSWRNFFKTMVLKSPLLIETNNVGFWAADIELLQTGQGGEVLGVYSKNLVLSCVQEAVLGRSLARSLPLIVEEGICLCDIWTLTASHWSLQWLNSWHLLSSFCKINNLRNI